MKPVNYECPHYYASQVLGEMKVLDGVQTMVMLCSPESLTMCYVDWNRELWEMLWQQALHFFDLQDASVPSQLHLQTQELHTVLKDFVHENSIIAVEVPTLECIDTKAYEPLESEHSQFY